MHTVARRLYDAQAFEDEVINKVAAAAADQELSYADFLKKYQISRPVRFKPPGLPAIQVLDLVPKKFEEKHQTAQAAVLHLPMANGLTRNKIFRAVILHLADPSQRLIVFANPGVPVLDRFGKPRLRHLPRIARGDLGPVAESGLAYLQAVGITSTTQYGYSYGADKALVMAAEASRYGIRVSKLVAADPASIRRRQLLVLFADFMAGRQNLERTLRRTETPLLKDSRKSRREHPVAVLAALLRPTNLAVARGLSRGGFDGRLQTAMQAQPGMKVHLVWGSESELATDEIMQAMVQKHAVKHAGRVSHTRLVGHDHSMADDVALHAAIMLQASRNLDRL